MRVKSVHIHHTSGLRRFRSVRFILGRLCNFEADWLEEHPEKFDMMMQQHVARRRWHNLELRETERVWIESHPTGRADTKSDVELIRSIIAVTRRRRD